MTREEEIQNACKTSIKETITCSGYGFTDRATDLLECAFEKGARWADETMIDKACKIYRDELLQFNSLLSKLNSDYDGLVDVERSLKNFKKAMEGGEE